MKAITAYFLLAVVFALAGALCLGLSRLDRDIAHAQQSVSTLKYDEADEVYARAERYFQYGSRVPWIGNGSLNDVRTRRAELRYWQGQYATITSQQPDPVGSVPVDNVGLQLVTANAVYRSGRTEAKDKQAILKAIETSIQGYTTILKNTPHQQDAAYNYEFLVRLRDEIMQGRAIPKNPGEVTDPNGREGFVLERGDASGLKLYVPLDKEERDKAGGPGKVAPIKRKG